MDDLNAKAARYLQALTSHEPLEGGLLFSTALRQLPLDYSQDSLDVVQRLLAQIYAQHPRPVEQWVGQPGYENFITTLAFYVGAVVGRLGNCPVQWCHYEQARARLAGSGDLPQERWASVVAFLRVGTCVPLGILEDHLCSAHPQVGVREYAVGLALRELQETDENARCQQLLQSFFNNQALGNGLAYRDVLKAVQLDYTLASLERLDGALRRLHETLRPTHESCVNQAPHQAFVRLVAFYVGMCTARVGGLSVKWLNFKELQAHLPELAFEFESSCGCLLDGRFYFPLGLVMDVLLKPTPQRTVHAWASGILASAGTPMQTILRHSLKATPTEPLAPAWSRAVLAVGFVAAWSLYMVEGGKPLTPMVYLPQAGAAGTFVQFGADGASSDTLRAAQDSLHTNAQNAPYQVLAYDGFANLSTGRTDAITLELRVYGEPSDALTLKIICPYRHAQGGEGFAIYSPKLLECSADPALRAAIFQQFYLGVLKFNGPGAFSWDRYLDERV